MGPSRNSTLKREDEQQQQQQQQQQQHQPEPQATVQEVIEEQLETAAVMTSSHEPEVMTSRDEVDHEASPSPVVERKTFTEVEETPQGETSESKP